MKLTDIIKEETINEALDYHRENKVPLSESIFRMYSESYFATLREARRLYNEGKLGELSYVDQELLETDIGTFGECEGIRVPLDCPIMVEMNEAEYQGRKVDLNKPKRGGSKKFYVYVMNPKTKKVKRVEFGAKSGGGKLAVKLKDPKARKAFSDRHNCPTKKDKTNAGSWSCRLPRFAKSLGLSGARGVFW